MLTNVKPFNALAVLAPPIFDLVQKESSTKMPRYEKILPSDKLYPVRIQQGKQPGHRKF
jgi:hypothetical protein